MARNFSVWQMGDGTDHDHECECDRPKLNEPRACGSAITRITWEPDYDVWAAWSGTEYSTAILYCPFCGVKLAPPEASHD